MKKLLALTTALSVAGLAANAQEITVMSFGGAYGASQMEAYHKPYQALTGIRINSVDADNPAIPLKAQVEAGNVTVDVADLEPSDLLRLCDEGALEVLPLDELPLAPDGTSWEDDFIDGGIYECGVGTIVYSTLIAYRTDSGVNPTSSADFFDLEKFPGKRGLRKGAKFALELALMADGVAPEDVYEALTTQEGVDRAFAKLDTIKSEVIWWEAGAQAPQLLADGEVVMTTGYNGRFFNAMIEENQPFELFWQNQILDFNLFVIPKGTPNRDAAWEFIKWATDTQRLADQAGYISYGPVRRSSMPLVGTFKDGVTEMARHLPTHPDNMEGALTTSIEFWADYDIELSERFNAWLASN
ncbi:MAG: polyamine ABC transporter substrate-binding protein [Gemmobacter sp.]